jgi:hypothetical protein
MTRQKTAIPWAAERLRSAVDLHIVCLFATVISDIVQFEKIG